MNKKINNIQTYFNPFMGDICSAELQPEPVEVSSPNIKVTDLATHPLKQNPLYFKINHLSMRFGQVERIRSTPNKSKFILTLQNSQELIKVELPVIRSYADQSLMDIGSTILNEKVPPVLDCHDTENNRQVHHHAKCADNNVLLKVYSFDSYHDPIFKNGLYEIAIYRETASSSFRNAYLIERGAPMSLVMMFNRYECTLYDVMRYRNLSRQRWTEDQQVYIAHQILNNYKRLKNNSVIHRDIRPSKIYIFGNSSSKNNRVSSQNYEFVNLESSRKISVSEHAQYGEEMLLTVRGVPTYCSDTVKELHDRNEEVGIYNYEENERMQLLKTIIGLETCDPYNKKQKIRKTHKLEKVCRKLADKEISFQKIMRQINELVKTISVESQNGILKSDSTIINPHFLQLLRRTHKERVQLSFIETLFLIHQREQFTAKLTKIIDENYLNEESQLNIPILHRLGEYYESTGIINNDYYRQQINLFIDLAENQRKRGFVNLNSSYLQKAMQISDKLSHKMRTPNTMSNLYTEFAYYQLQKNHHAGAEKYINEALLEGGRSDDVSIEIQLKVLQAKGIIETEINGVESGDDYFQKGLELSGNRNNFSTQVEMLESKGRFQHRLGDNYLRRIEKKGDMGQGTRAKYMGKCESLLLMAREAKMEIPDKNTISLIKINLSLGKLAAIQQNYADSLKALEKAERLFSASEVQLSPSIKLNILETIYKLYENHIDNPTAKQKTLKKIVKIKQKGVKMVEHDRNNFEKIRLGERRKERPVNEGIIQEQKEKEEQQMGKNSKYGTQ